MKALWLLVLALTAAPSALADYYVDVVVSPASPNQQSLVTLVATVRCGEIVSFTRVGTTITLSFDGGSGCVATPLPITQTVDLGRLDPGTYTVRYIRPDLPSFSPVVVLSFAVAEVPAVPTLETWALGVLAAVLALVALRRGL